MTLSDAQLRAIADKLFLLQDAARTNLPKPTNTTGTNSLASRLDPTIGNDPRYTGIGIGVIDFTKDKFVPKIWLHNGDDSWRIASTGKISVLLAAVQLRDDVRWVEETGFLSTPQEYDDLFSMSRLWKTAPITSRQIAGKDHAPRISTIFDFTKRPVDFYGPDPNTPDVADIIRRLAAGGEAHLTWPLTTDFEFSERLWLAGARSDNIAATSCISEIGVAYIKAVQRAYRLFDPNPKNGMHLLLAGPYSRLDTKIPVSNRSDVKYRELKNVETNFVKDALFNRQSRRYDNQASWQPGSAAALTAYMIALIQDNLVALGHGLGNAACNTIRSNLASGVSGTLTSYIANGARTITEVKKEISKIGALTAADGEPGPLYCEFTYLETEERGPGARKIMKYGVVATGIRSKPQADGSPGLSAANLAENIGLGVHRALLAP